MRAFPWFRYAVQDETSAHVSQTAGWLQRKLFVDGGFRFAEGCDKSLLATCFATCALELFGALDTLTAEQRESLASGIQSCQSEATGLFRDPQHADSALLHIAKFTPLYIEWQESYFALHALDALGHEARHPLSFVEPLRQPAALDLWLRTLRMDDFWFSSNYLMFLLLFLLLVEGDASPTAHRVLDRLDAWQDPKTGFWGTTQGSSLFNGMAGAFHVYGFYRYLGRPIGHQGAAVRSTIELQEPSGLFGDPGGGACEDLDAIDILAKLEPATDADERAVQQTLSNAMYGLRACRKGDGSYCWSSPLRNVQRREVSYSGLPRLRVNNDAGDAWSTWMRPLAIALASGRLGQAPNWPLCYRRLPLLGWHARGAGEI